MTACVKKKTKNFKLVYILHLQIFSDFFNSLHLFSCGKVHNLIKLQGCGVFNVSNAAFEVTLNSSIFQYIFLPLVEKNRSVVEILSRAHVAQHEAVGPTVQHMARKTALHVDTSFREQTCNPSSRMQICAHFS